MKSQELGTSTTRIKLNFAMRYISSQNFVDHNDSRRRRRRRRRLWRLRCPSNPKHRKSCKYKENLWFLLVSKTTNSIASNHSSVCLSLYRLLLTRLGGCCAIYRDLFVVVAVVDVVHSLASFRKSLEICHWTSFVYFWPKYSISTGCQANEPLFSNWWETEYVLCIKTAKASLVRMTEWLTATRYKVV